MPVADICRVPSDSLNSIKESCVCAFGIAVAVKGTEKAGRDMDKSIANRKRNTKLRNMDFIICSPFSYHRS